MSCFSEEARTAVLIQEKLSWILVRGAYLGKGHKNPRWVQNFLYPGRASSLPVAMNLDVEFSELQI